MVSYNITNLTNHVVVNQSIFSNNYMTSITLNITQHLNNTLSNLVNYVQANQQLNVNLRQQVTKVYISIAQNISSSVTWLYVQPTTTPTTTTTTTTTGTPPTTTTEINGTTTTTTVKPGTYEFKYNVDYDPTIVINYPLYGMTYVYVYPSSNVRGSYQYVCSSNPGCGYCAYIQIAAWTEQGYNHLYVYIYDERTKTVITDYSTVVSSNVAKVEVFHDNVTWYSSIGYAWKVSIYDNDTKVYTTGVVWFATQSWFTSGKVPYPILVDVMYSTENDVGKVSIEQGKTAQFCPFKDPMSCGLWYFWNWLSTTIYNMLPEPIKMVINAIGYFFDMLRSILAWITNPEVIKIVSITLGIYLFGGSIVSLLEGGPVKFMDFWRFNFELMKKLFDLIVKAVTLIIPFK